MKKCLILLFSITIKTVGLAQEKPIRLGVAGLTHGHVGWILGRENQTDMVMVGIVEPNKLLAKKLSKEFGFPMTMVFDSMEEMIAKTKPEAVAAFGNIKDHLKVVQECAPKGIHIMVEKPLATTFDDAVKIANLAKIYKVHVLTNYETSWYETNVKALDELKNGTIGELRKVIIRDGHKGPKKIGVSQEFLEWLTDPVLNGGGAITDFGCYGANLMTWIMNGKKPLSVTAVTQQLQADNNPNVDDDATIILTYPNQMAILEPSWNWPIGRKDMELYGTKGAIYADNPTQLRIRISKGYSQFTEEIFLLPQRKKPFNDPFSVFTAVIKDELQLPPFNVYSLENNMVVMQILQAAIESAKSGKTIYLTK
ncbi:Gfo/Idh/MocA family oxidoreductase [Maribacter confluentis]|uniref:Gfo/Idh/MocA family oxidoreductase n=1 Tax=Maribacter confluentis TaxID=1656093 RepID=A0ABT8RMT7_9FLAO|nr:Gfo/Idh/MocA family oxidoreductase [Maribacter confluentis]MDO1511772.1 Gfo/Idh/MocA family oxidoreductase [Maribacter confluentis]